MTEAVDKPDEASPADVDCLIIGGGPAGLTAAVYLGRFRRCCTVIDAGAPRASLIPKTHNYPGFPPGISGDDLLARLREQASGYGAQLETGRIDSLRPHPLGFEAHYGGRRCIARCVILATGVADTLPDMAHVDAAIAAGALRLCAICDGFEVDGHEVAVLGEAATAVRHAVFLRTFTDRLTAVTCGVEKIDDEVLALAHEHDIRVLACGTETLAFVPGEGIALTTRDGATHGFDVIYPVLGARKRSELALELGAQCDGEDALLVDKHQQTTVDGLYAVGDVVSGLMQISVAIGQAAQCATAVHNRLPSNPCRMPWGHR